MPEYRCSSCGKSKNQVARIVCGPSGLHLCNECVYLYLELLKSPNKPDEERGTGTRANNGKSTTMETNQPGAGVPMAKTTYRGDALFAGKDQGVQDTYDRILDVVSQLGPFEAEPKKTSIHLAHSVEFAGVHPRKTYLYLNLRTDRPIDNPRIVKAEQVSKNRYQNEVKLSSRKDVDAEVVGWLRHAYVLR